MPAHCFLSAGAKLAVQPVVFAWECCCCCCCQWVIAPLGHGPLSHQYTNTNTNPSGICVKLDQPPPLGHQCKTDCPTRLVILIDDVCRWPTLNTIRLIQIVWRVGVGGDCCTRNPTNATANKNDADGDGVSVQKPILVVFRFVRVSLLQTGPNISPVDSNNCSEQKNAHKTVVMVVVVVVCRERTARKATPLRSFIWMHKTTNVTLTCVPLSIGHNVIRVQVCTNIAHLVGSFVRLVRLVRLVGTLGVCVCVCVAGSLYSLLLWHFFFELLLMLLL